MALDSSNPNPVEAWSLIDAMLDGRMSPESEQRLQELACDHEAVASLYFYLLHQECVVAAHAAPAYADLSNDDLTDDSVAKAFASHETMILPALRAEPSKSERFSVAPPFPKALPEALPRSQFGRRRLLGLAAMMMVTVGIAILLGRRPTRPLPPAVATIIAEHDARWGAANMPLGASALSSTEVTLTSGVVEIEFTSGATVVLEAPARFTAMSPGWLALAAGKLTATVPPPAHGFTVSTPSAVVVDLGTQFGLSLQQDGSTDVAVFEGQVQAGPAVGGSLQLLRKGAAAKVTGGSVMVDPKGATPQYYIRSLAVTAKALDVVDLVAGGDGATGRRSLGIDPNTGNFVTVGNSRTVMGDGTYRRIASAPVLDGCFVPTGKGPEQVDSAGHTFSFSRTSGETIDVIWAGGPIEAMNTGSFHPVLGSIDYSQGEHAYIHFHANKGLTFDLDAIRRLHPGVELARFRSVAGNTSAVNHFARPGYADIRVLLDGQLRSSRLHFLPTEAPLDVDVPIGTNDRFLTLVATDGGDGIGCDWVVWGDPRIETRIAALSGK